VRQGHAFVHRHARERDERDDVDGAEPGMLSPVRAHVDLAVRDVDESVRRGEDGIRLARVREDGAVVIYVGGLIQEAHALDRADRVRESVDDVAATALAHVGDALDEIRQV
jgi:hypothetical protein